MKWLSLILLLSLALVAFVLLRMPDPQDAGRAAETAAAEGQKRTEIVQAPRLQPLAAYAAITDRALFTRERSVKKAPKKQKPVVARQEPRLMLQALGIAVSEEGFIAIVKNRRTNKIERLRLHQKIDGWELVSITTEGFSFSKAGKKIFVVFKKSGGGG